MCGGTSAQLLFETGIYWIASDSPRSCILWSVARILISAGEASGDAYGAALVRELRDLRPGLDIEGLGGTRMRAEGVRLHADSSQWGAISIVQSLRVYPRLVGGYYRIKRALTAGEPGLFVPIDFGYANVRLARHAKNRGWKVLWFVPPSSWRRDRQGADVARLSDEIVTPFPWSAEILRGMGASAHFFGHPIKSLRGEPFAGERRGIALLPGSRTSEIELLLPLYREAVAGLAGPFPIPVPEAQRALAARVWGDANDLAPSVPEALAGARGAVVCSGTATLEAALARVPFVVAYRLSPATVREAKLLRVKRPKYIALPNIILDRMAVPEFVQDEATPEAIRGALDALLADGSPARAEQLASFEELDALLGPSDAVRRTAELALTLLGR